MLNVKILDLDRQNLHGAFSIAAQVFDDAPSVPVSLLASLGVAEVAGHPYLEGAPWRRYWVATAEHDGKTESVVGMIGLYMLEADQSEAAWVNWFAVSPEHRGRGIGRKLLDHAIHATYMLKKPILRLWTTDQERERDAQFLYERMGFHEIARKAIPGKIGAHEITRECEIGVYASLQENDGGAVNRRQLARD